MSEAVTVIWYAGPLIALGKLNRLDLLAGLYEEVNLPQAVYDDFVRRGGIRGEPDARTARPDIWISAQLCLEVFARLRNSINGES